MIFSEKDLEDYICNNQEQFIEMLKEIYGKDKSIKFIGRQVKIGERNIADLIYYYDNIFDDTKFGFTDRNYIIVKLKYRELEPKDLAQISRYMSILNEKLYSDENLEKDIQHIVHGLFVSFGQNDLMQEISINMEDTNIDYVQIKNNIIFEKESWSHKEKYIESIELDNRILKLYGEKNE